MLHPGFFTDRKLLALTFQHRVLFAGLWLIADRNGRLEDEPIEIKMKLLPADNVDVDSMLSDLERSGLVVRYSAGGCRFLCVPKFRKYQKPHYREKASVIPPPLGSVGDQDSMFQIVSPPDDAGVGPPDESSPSPPEYGRSVTVTVNQELEEKPQASPVLKIEDAFTVVPRERRDSARRALSDALCSDFSEHRAGNKYDFTGPKDGTALTRLMKKASPEEIRRRWRIGLMADGYFRTSSIAALDSKWNDLAVPNPVKAFQPAAPPPDNTPKLRRYTADEDPYAPTSKSK
jgi:hypothetical protein